VVVAVVVTLPPATPPAALVCDPLETSELAEAEWECRGVWVLLPLARVKGAG